MGKIFISYRRDDAQHQADRLYDCLTESFAREDVFMDVDNIPLGVNFVDYLDQKVGQCEILLALIGRDWLAELQRRAEDPTDFVRIEIASALKRGIPVIPVLFDGAPMPSGLDLPDDVRELVQRNGIEIRRVGFREDVARLVNGLNHINSPQSEEAAKLPAPKAKAGKPFDTRIALAALALIALPLGGFGVFKMMERPTATPEGGISSRATPENTSNTDNSGSQSGADASTGKVVEREVEISPPASPDAERSGVQTEQETEDPAARKDIILRLQTALKTLGRYDSGMDGAAGPGTIRAAKGFAVSSRLTAPDLKTAPLEDLEAFTKKVETTARDFEIAESSAWVVAQRTDTVRALQGFLEEYANGAHAEQANLRLNELIKNNQNQFVSETPASSTLNEPELITIKNSKPLAVYEIEFPPKSEEAVTNNNTSDKIYFFDRTGLNRLSIKSGKIDLIYNFTFKDNRGVCVDKYDKFILVGVHSRKIYLFKDEYNGARPSLLSTKELDYNSGWLQCASFADNQFIYAVDGRSMIHKWRILETEPTSRRQLVGGPHPNYHSRFSNGGSLVAIEGNDGTIQLWNTLTARKLKEISSDDDGYRTDVIRNVQFSPNEKLIATYSGRAGLSIWDVSNLNSPIHQLKTDIENPIFVFSQNSKQIALANSKKVQTIDLDSFEKKDYLFDAQKINALAYANGGDKLVAFTQREEKNFVYVYDLTEIK